MSTASSKSGSPPSPAARQGWKIWSGLFLSALEPPLADGYGCLVNNSIIEFGSAEGIASADIADTLAMVREAIGNVLKRELGSAALTAETMRLVVLYHGILTLSRGRTPFNEMADVVRAEFERLKALRNHGEAGAASPSVRSL